jgi:hypothetical protein
VIIIRAESTSATKGLMMSFKNEETSQWCVRGSQASRNIWMVKEKTFLQRFFTCVVNANASKTVLVWLNQTYLDLLVRMGWILLLFILAFVSLRHTPLQYLCLARFSRSPLLRTFDVFVWQKLSSSLNALCDLFGSG